MVWLDGFGYQVHRSAYSDKSSTFASWKRSLTGKPIVIESAVFAQSFTIQLNVSQPETELLQASFVTCHGTPAYLDFIDERGVRYDPANGTDSATHKFNTGVWFESLGEPKPTELLFGKKGEKAPLPFRRFVVEIKLAVNAKALA